MNFYKHYLNHEMNFSTRVKAFTLVELVMVVVLLSVLSITVLPRFFSKDSFDQRFFTDSLIYSIKYAQKIAVATGCLTQLQISANQYQITQDSNCFNSSAVNFNQTVWHPVNYQWGYTESFDGSSISLTASQNPIIFNAQGSPLNSALALSATITIQVTAATSQTVSILSDSGWVGI